MMNKTISVIMPSLNVRDYIEKSVGSVLCQTYEDLEILCIDAGSDDGTERILPQLAAKDRRIQFIEMGKSARSYGRQVNEGIRRAAGKYIVIVETDDYIDSDMLGCLFTAAETNRCDYVKADYYTFFTQRDGSDFCNIRRTFPSNSDLYGRVICPLEHPEISIGDFRLWTGIYRTDFLRDKGCWFNESPGAAYQDIGFIHLTTTRTQRAEYLPYALYYYRIDREGASSNTGYGLHYIYEEYRQLEKHRSESEGCALFCRMAKSFVLEGRKWIFRNAACRKQGDSRGNNVDFIWLKEQLQNAEQRGLLSGLPDEWRLQFHQTAYHPEKIQEEAENFRRLLNAANSMNKRIQVIIAGCGDLGNQLFHIFSGLNLLPCCFIDNNRDLQGGMFQEIQILSPEMAAARYGTALYFIANATYSEKIRMQLIDLGIPQNHIAVYI